MKVKHILDVVPECNNHFRLFVSELTGGYELTEKIESHLEIEPEDVILCINGKFSATIEDLRNCGAKNIYIKDGNARYNVLSYAVSHKDSSVVFYYLRRKKLNTIFAVLGVVIAMFIAIIASTLVGGIVGWIVDFPFPEVNDAINTIFHINLTAFDFGATLGFVGSFFKSHKTA